MIIKTKFYKILLEYYKMNLAIYPVAFNDSLPSFYNLFCFKFLEIVNFLVCYQIVLSSLLFLAAQF